MTGTWQEDYRDELEAAAEAKRLREAKESALWDAQQEYWAVVYGHESTQALPIALFVHREDADMYMEAHETPDALKVQLWSIWREEGVLTIRGHGINVAEPVASCDYCGSAAHRIDMCPTFLAEQQAAADRDAATDKSDWPL